ncbi:hypothetical protein SBA2_320008 [Acidobacteriia bacterium SbA2]|nr:hypothetical protein SBA2_320008 [Acidobacteriia bacterium SbA2]
MMRPEGAHAKKVALKRRRGRACPTPNRTGQGTASRPPTIVFSWFLSVLRLKGTQKPCETRRA